MTSAPKRPTKEEIETERHYLRHGEIVKLAYELLPITTVPNRAICSTVLIRGHTVKLLTYVYQGPGVDGTSYACNRHRTIPTSYQTDFKIDAIPGFNMPRGVRLWTMTIPTSVRRTCRYVERSLRQMGV